MNKFSLTTLLAAGLCAGSANAAILAGDIIAIDFGSTATAESNWNTSVTGSSVDLVRQSNGTNTDVDLTLDTTGGSTSAWASFQDGSSQGGSAVSTIYSDGIILAGGNNDEIRLTFTGLDDSLTYNLFAGGQTPGDDFGATWTISTFSNEGTLETRFQNTNSFVNFTGITSSGGSFTLTFNDISNGSAPSLGRNIGISELTLTAVPEPSSTALLGLGGLVLILRRRK